MKLKKKGGELLKINVKEVSVVDAPANQRKFLFFKGDLEKANADIRIESDGTLEGTKITVNGKEVEDLKSFYFNYFKPADDEELYIDPVSCSYTVTSDAEDGFQTSQTYNLAKAEGKRMDYARLGAFIKALTEKEVTEAQFKKMDQPTLDQLLILSQYEGQMPDDLAGAVGHFLKDMDADGGTQDPPEDPDTSPTSELPPETLESLKGMVEALNTLITGKKPEDATGDEAVVEKIKSIVERIGKLEKGEKPETTPGPNEGATDSADAKLLDLLKAYEERLQVVEKSSGVEKSIDTTQTAGGEEVKDLYPSIPL